MEAQSTTMHLLQLLLMLFGVDQAGLPPGEPDLVVQRAAPVTAVYRSDWTAPGKGDPGAPGIDGFFADVEISSFRQALDRAHRDFSNELDHDFGVTLADWDHAEANLFRMKFLKHVLVRHAGSLWIEPTPAFDEAVIARAQKKLEGSDANENGDASYPGTLEAIPPFWRVSSMILLIRAGDEADRVQKVLELCLGLEEATGNKAHEFRHANLMAVPVIMHRQENDLWVAIGESALRQALERSRQSPEIKAERAIRYEQAISRLGISRIGATHFVDVEGLRDLLRKIPEPAVQAQLLLADLAGLNSVQSCASATGVSQGTLTMRGQIVFNQEPQGLWHMLDTPALTEKDFERVPAKAELVAAIKLSPAQWLKTFRKTMKETVPGSQALLDETIQQMNTELGVMVEEDIFSAFGDTWILFASSEQGAVLDGGLIGSWEVRDPRKAVAAFAEIMKVVANSVSVEDGAKVQQTEFMDRTIYTIETPSYSILRTTWSLCLTDRHLVVASHPQAIKAYLRFLQSGQPGFNTTMTGKKSLSKEGQVLGYVWMDSATILTPMISLWSTWLDYSGLVNDGFGEEESSRIQAIDFPSAAAILPYVQPGRATVVRSPRAITLEVERPLPLIAVMESLLRSYLAEYEMNAW